MFFVKIMFLSKCIILSSEELCFDNMLEIFRMLIIRVPYYGKQGFMQTKYLCVLIHIRIKGQVGAVKPV